MIIKFKEQRKFTFGGEITTGKEYTVENTIETFSELYVGFNDDRGIRIGFKLIDRNGIVDSNVEIVSDANDNKRAIS